MTDVQVRGKKIALLDSSDKIIYTLPDSAGTAGNAIVTDGAGKLFFGGINLNSVLTAGDSSNLNATILGNVRLGNTVVDQLAFARPGEFASYGYAVGGSTGPASSTNVSTADRYPFAAETITSSQPINALSRALRHIASNASTTHAYSSGGSHESDPQAVSSGIEKFSFGSNSFQYNVGDLSQVRIFFRDATQSLTHGYQAGGFFTPPSTSQSNVIEKFPFSTDTNATDVGDLTVGRDSITAPGSSTHGYEVGGRGFPTATPNFVNIIEKYPFSSDANATDVGDLTVTRRHGASSQNSSTHGYASGGRQDDTRAQDDMQKFPFATDENATNVGNLSGERYYGAGSSSQDKGYHAGGGNFINPGTPFSVHDDIFSFPFATDASSNNPAGLSNNRWTNGGTQG